MANTSPSILPEPTIEPLTWQGAPVTPSRIIDLWTRNWLSAEWDKKNVKRARDFRRGTLRIQIDKDFSKLHPELSWVVSPMAERLMIEQEQIARIVSVLPQVSRATLGEREMDDRYAEEFERYMQDWVEQKVPRKEFGVKGVEDGGYGVAVLPAELDMDGDPDFYDRLDERAWKALEDDRQSAYTKDAKDPKGRYARLDANGHKIANPKWDRNKGGLSKAEAEKKGQGKTWTRDEKASQQAHQDARNRYLLQQDAVSVRIIPHLDCVPIWGRGKGRSRFELVGLIERSLVSVEEALDAEYGWVGMGNRRLIPRGYNDTRTTGVNGEYYLYTAYLTSKDKQTGIEHPMLFSCLGGYGTWSTSPRYPSGTPDDKNSVAVLDLYKTHGLTGKFWDYFPGMSTGDDDPYHRTRPWITPFLEPLLAIEGTTTQIRIATALNATTGYNYKPDAGLAGADDEAITEAVPGGGRKLRQPVLAKPGQIVTNAGDITPQMAANVSADIFRQLADEKGSLLQNTATGQASNASGNALTVSEEITSVNQAQVRDGMAAATRFCAERAARIFTAVATDKRFELPWPLATTKKPSLGPEGKDRPGETVSVFNPDWTGDERNYSLSCAFPSEENLARIDLEAKLKQMGLSSNERVWAAMAVDDPMEMRLQIAKDRLWDMPENQALFNERVAAISENRKLLKVLRLKAAKQMVDGGVPGMAAGMPAAMLNRQQAQPVQPGPQSPGAPPAGVGTASDIRGGIQGGEMNAQRQAAAVQSAAHSVPGQAA